MAGFAVLKDYDNVLDAEVDVWHERIGKYSENEIFAAAEKSHTLMMLFICSTAANWMS